MEMFDGTQPVPLQGLGGSSTVLPVSCYLQPLLPRLLSKTSPAPLVSILGLTKHEPEGYMEKRVCDSTNLTGSHLWKDKSYSSGISLPIVSF